MGQYNVPPVLLVGMQGMYGIFVATTALVFVNLMKLEITFVAFHQLQKSTPLLTALIVSIFAVAVINFSSVTVTQLAGAASRSTLDAACTIIIWAVELALGWASFNEVQLIVFVMLASGTLVYNRILVLGGPHGRDPTL